MVSAHAVNNNQTNSGIIGDATPLAGIDLYLDVTLNGNPVGLVHFGYENEKLYAGANTLRQLGFRLPQNAAATVSLNDIAQLSIDYNVEQQTLALTVPLSSLDLATTQVNPTGEATPIASNSRGALLNYDVYAQQGDETSANTFSELRAFNGLGVLSTTQLTQYSTAPNADNAFYRMDTRWRTSFPENMLAINVGDTLTSSLTWSRPTRIGGIQIGTDFSLQPYMPTTPLPSYLGSATLPSNVELYVNGIKYYNGEVPAGSFQINTMPNISGAGTGQVMMTDALGRTTVQNFSFYNDQQLLREGLTAWSAELGAVRENYGYASFDYASAPVFSGTWRRGFSNTFTAGTHAETSDGLINAGFSNDWVPSPRSGTVSTALAASTDSGKSGFLYSVGYRWSGEQFNFSTSTTATSGDYRDVATHYGEPPPSLSSNTVIGYAMASAGNVSLSYLQFRYPHDSAVRYANASWFKSVTENISLNAGFNQNIDDTRDRSVYLMVTVTTSGNLSASSTVQHTNNETGYQINASQTPPGDGGWGWNVAASQQASRQSGQGEVGYLGRFGKAYTGFSRLPDNTTVMLVRPVPWLRWGEVCSRLGKSTMVLPSYQQTAFRTCQSSCKTTLSVAATIRVCCWSRHSIAIKTIKSVLTPWIYPPICGSPALKPMQRRRIAPEPWSVLVSLPYAPRRLLSLMNRVRPFLRAAWHISLTAQASHPSSDSMEWPGLTAWNSTTGYALTQIPVAVTHNSIIPPMQRGLYK